MPYGEAKMMSVDIPLDSAYCLLDPLDLLRLPGEVKQHVNHGSDGVADFTAHGATAWENLLPGVQRGRQRQVFRSDFHAWMTRRYGLGGSHRGGEDMRPRGLK